jgi:hypothetical protein
LAVVFVILTAAACDPNPEGEGYYERLAWSDEQFTEMSLSGTDKLGREVKPAYGLKSDKKYVGLFYFLWMGTHAMNMRQVYDNTKLIAGGQEAELLKKDSALFGNDMHFWGEPLYGYYNQADEWVVRRHVELLTAAGVDFLALDATNGLVYIPELTVLLKVLDEFYQQGFDVPKITFLSRNYNGAQSTIAVETLYKWMYVNNLYKHLWFAPNGKPMIAGVAPQSALWDNKEYIRDFFDYKETHWPAQINGDDGLPWIDFSYPQTIAPVSRTISVSVAQHPGGYMSRGSSNFGRGWSFKENRNLADRTAEGVNFGEQWETALQNGDKVDIVMITGWNEWIASRLTANATIDSAYFVDAYNLEYSRDIEMTKGGFSDTDGYGDNYYMQMVKNIRKFKYNDAKPLNWKTAAADMFDAQADWSAASRYRDFAGDAVERDHYGIIRSLHYENRTNRNDITAAQVIHDAEYVYIRVHTREAVTPQTPDDKGWMNILFKTDGDDLPNFAGYHFILNQNPGADGQTTLGRFTGNGFETAEAARAQYAVDGKTISFKIPLSALGGKAKFEFKVTDNVASPEDMASYYIHGDSAPLGRLNFAYGY